MVFAEDYATHPRAYEPLRAAGVQALALLPLGAPPAALVLAVARTRQESHWSVQERALLEAAARTVRSVIERRRYLLELERAALVDELTGLGNRRAFMRDLEASLAGPGMLVVLDVDGFKAVNDTHGHARGDELLRELGGHLTEAFAGGRSYRLGGDEFAVLVPEGNVEVLQSAVTRVVQALRHAGHAVGISFGHALFPDEADDVEPLLALADRRMYALKRRRASERQWVAR